MSPSQHIVDLDDPSSFTALRRDAEYGFLPFQQFMLDYPMPWV